jgi:hypothetical protein
MTKPIFIIWAPSFDDSSGGVIALHMLCRRLNEIGEHALIWEPGRPAVTSPLELKEWLKAVRYEVGRTKRLYRRGPFSNPVAKRSDLKDAIVIYPEIVEGNPLGVEKVVRWLLHRPGYHTGQVAYGPHDLYFFYQEAFDDPKLNRFPDNRLTLTWFNEAYTDRGSGERSGTAYLIRKGEGRPIVHDLTDSTCVDHLSHEGRAEVFRRTKYFFTYDLYTMYGLYAALCGCIPVVVPDPALSKEDWTPREADRYGIAYGMDDVAWAIATRNILLERVQQVRQEQDEMVRRFVRRCHEAL